MDITPLGYCTADTGVISALADKPNAAGMTAAQVKSKFDADGTSIKTYINDTLVPYVNDTVRKALEQNEKDIDDTLAEMHSHENKALLDSYTHSDGAIGDALGKSHVHDNADVLNSFTKTMRELMVEIYANAKLEAHPVGSVYISEVDTEPETLFGGTWERIKDRFLLAAGDTYTAGDTDGAATVTLTEEQAPKKSWGFLGRQMYKNRSSHWNYENVSVWSEGGEVYSLGQGANQYYFDAVYWSYGGGKAHNNMPPYKVYYMWVRTA